MKEATVLALEEDGHDARLGGLDELCREHFPWQVLGTPEALAQLSELARSAQKAEGPAARALAKGRLLAAGEWLGLLQQDPQSWFQGDKAAIDVARIEALMSERQEARKTKDFARADAIRNELTEMGVVLEDTPQGPRWKLG